MEGRAQGRRAEVSNIASYTILFHASLLPHSFFEQRRTAHLGSPEGLYRCNVWMWRA